MSFPVERVVAGKLDIGSGADYFKSNGYFVDTVAFDFYQKHSIDLRFDYLLRNLTSSETKDYF